MQLSTVTYLCQDQVSKLAEVGLEVFLCALPWQAKHDEVRTFVGVNHPILGGLASKSILSFALAVCWDTA